MTLTRDQIVATCDRYLAAMSAGDHDAIMACFAPDAVQEEPAGAAPNVGHDAIRAFFEKSLRTRIRSTRLGPVTVVGNRAVFQLRVDILNLDLPPLTSSDVVEFDEQGRFTSIIAFPDLEAHPGDTGPALDQEPT